MDMGMNAITVTVLEGFVGYKSFCSYGDYQSKRYGTPGRAQHAGKAHCRKRHPNSTVDVVYGKSISDLGELEEEMPQKPLPMSIKKAFIGYRAECRDCNRFVSNQHADKRRAIKAGEDHAKNRHAGRSIIWVGV